MKYFVILILLLSGNLSAQNLDTINGGPVNIPCDHGFIDCMYKCEFDTIIKIHENALLVISDSNLYHYNFSSGTKNYIEIIVDIKKCRCSDCESSENIIIEYTNLLAKETLNVDSLCTKWFRLNSWIFPKEVSNFNGKLIKEENKYSLILNEYSSEKNSRYVLEETAELKNLQIKP